MTETSVAVNEALAAFVSSRLDEDEAAAKAAADDGRFGGRAHWSARYGNIITDAGDPDWAVADLTSFAEDRGVGEHIARHDPARVLAEVRVWRRLLLEYQTLGLDAKYAGTERETGFHFALSAALKAKAAVWYDHPDYREDW